MKAGFRMVSAVCASAALWVVPNEGHADEDLLAALKGGTPILDMRYRLELVNQSGLPNNALASTVRVRAGYETGSYYGISILGELEHVSHLGNDTFNDTVNGKTTYPVVADPKVTQLNRLQISYTGIPDTKVTLGRQRIILDNARFVGNVGWRQNEQTFDAVRVENRSLPDTTLTYIFVNKVNRIFGDNSAMGDFEGENHLINGRYEGIKGVAITAFAYLVDIEEAPALSSQTYGARVSGQHKLKNGVELDLEGSYAHQSDYSNNPDTFSHNYAQVEGKVGFKPVAVVAGYELLDGNGATAFQTPLATLHAYQGWADVFLTTPASGMQDFKAGLTAHWTDPAPYVNAVDVAAFYHDYSASSGSADLGSEWNLNASAKLPHGASLLVKYADYQGNGFAPDRKKIWFQLAFVY